MPTKRFENLDDKRKKIILDAARKEFASDGFRDASLNGIIKNAGISKGSLYYYFEDKTDLYLAVMEKVFLELFGSASEVEAELTADNFWQVFEEQTLSYMNNAINNPDVVVLSRDLYQMNDALHASEAIGDFYKKVQEIYSGFFVVGRELGVVRSDIPLDLLLSVMTHMGAALDYWVFERWDDFTREELDSFAALYSNMIRKIASPEREEGGEG